MTLLSWNHIENRYKLKQLSAKFEWLTKIVEYENGFLTLNTI